MNCANYSVLALFWLTYGLTDGNSDFFESSSKSGTEWDPSRDFFEEYTVENKDYPQYRKEDSHSGRKDISTGHYNNKENLRYKAYLSRLINILLSSTGFREDVFEKGSKTLRVDLTLSKEDFDILKQFGSNKEISLESLENSFRSMFNSKYSFNSVTSAFMEYLQYAVLIALLFAIVTFIAFILRKITFKISTLSFILFIAYISIVLHGLLKQYEDISENLILKRLEFENIGTPPKECYYSKMTYMEKIYMHIFKDDPCQRFLKSRRSVWYEIDFASAFVFPFQAIFSTLCSMLGEGSEKMMKPFIERSPWPMNIMLEFLLTIIQLPLLFFAIVLIFFALTSRTISLKIPFISMSAEKKHYLNYDPSSKKPKEEIESHTSEGSIKTYVVNQGGIVLLGNEERQFQMHGENFFGFNHLSQLKGPPPCNPNFSGNNSKDLSEILGSQKLDITKPEKGFCIQRNNSLDFDNQQQSFKIFQQSNDSFMNRNIGCLEDMKSGSIVNKQLAINRKEVRREHKKLTYFKKINFKPNKRGVTLKVAKENLDILPLS